MNAHQPPNVGHHAPGGRGIQVGTGRPAAGARPIGPVDEVLESAVVDDPALVELARAGMTWVAPFSDQRGDMTSYNLAMPGFLVGSNKITGTYRGGRWHLHQPEDSGDGPGWTASGPTLTASMLALIAKRCGYDATFAPTPPTCGRTPTQGCCDPGFCSLGHDEDDEQRRRADREADA